MTKAIENMSFEDALSELEDIIKQIETGQATLEESIKSFERGALLRSHCNKKLSEAKLKIEKIVQNAAGEVTTEAM